MRTTTTRRTTLLTLGAVALGALVLGGCSNDKAEVTHGYYKNTDITPVAESSVGNADAIDRMATFTTDTNLRRLQDDVHRFFLLDAPSTLSPKRGIFY